MSRLMNLIKMGYVPTPPPVVERVAAFLRVEGPCHFLDPCCGMGEALAQLRGLLACGSTTFGIELDVQRSEAAAVVLDHVLHGSYEHALVSKGQGGAELLWLNPPYSTDTKAGRRLELTFLRETQDWLRPGGVLVYIVRQPHLSGHVARRLSTWFEDLCVYRFPGSEYDTYQQVVVMGIKRPTAQEDDGTCMRILQAARATLPEIPESPDRPPYVIPVRPPNAAWRFRSKRVSPEEIQAETLASGVWQGRWWLERQVPMLQQDERPLMPLRLGHLALFLAAGLLNNVELSREEEHLLIKGHTRKVEVEVTTPEEKDEGITRTVEEFRTTIQVLDLETGEASLLDDPDRLTTFVETWQDQLSQAVVSAYPPIHDLHLEDDEETILAPLLRHKRLAGRRDTGLLPVQKQAAVAGRKAVRRHGSVSLVMATGTGKTATSLGIARLLQADYLRRRETR